MAEIIQPGDSGGDQGREQPKIHVDSDWKAQAQAEKAKLEQQESERAAKQGAGEGAGQGGMPEPSFRTLMSELASQAYLFLGAIPDPKTGQAVVAPEYARHYIDMLSVLEEKTEGNLTEEESNDLTQVLNELRQLFVRVVGYVSEMQAKQEAEGAAGQGAGQSPEQGGGASAGGGGQQG